MNTNTTEELDRLVSKLIDQQLGETEAARLSVLLGESPAALARYHELLDNHEALCAIYPGDVYEAGLDSAERVEPVSPAATLTQTNWRHWALAASILIGVGLAGYFVGQGSGVVMHGKPVASQLGPATEIDTEQEIAGHATLRRAVGVQWSNAAGGFREGDVLPAGNLQFSDGVAEIDFFCGATLIVEGPASMNVESDWVVRVDQGRLRANVPPAAQGFVVKAAGSEIIDLGTEFALDVGADNARLEVIDGEVKLRGGKHDSNHLVTGERRWLKAADAEPDAFQDLSTVGDVQRRRAKAQAQRFPEWKQHAQQLAADPRLIAYYPIAEAQSDRDVRNAAATGDNRDGKIVGPVERTAGRFGSQSIGLEFDRPGSRVRTRIDGEFQAFTFTCWVRIDSLEHAYNALFMSDGYETGELHWQIRHDGRLMFSVMVDDTQSIRHFSKLEQRIVETAGLARVYFTEPIWDISQSGRWFHLAAVYDPAGRRVVQYVNGEQVSSEEIIDKFYIETLRIGPAEIGNWGQPFRKTPLFAVRNLNGTIDELAIFDAVLADDEIHNLYEQGLPFGY